MAVCPKCKQKIPIFHIGQLCPNCKVNIRFYDFDKKFYHDAKKAELSLAKISILIAHLKANFIGSKLAVIRLCTMILPVLSLLVPYAGANISQPFYDGKLSLSALGLFNAFSDGSLDYVLAMKSGGPDRLAFISLFAAIIGIAVVTVFALLVFLLTVLSIINIRKMPKVICAVSLLGIAATITATVLCFRFPHTADIADGVLLSGNVSFGYVITVIAFAVVFVVNLLILKNGLNIIYKEGDIERKEIAKKVKNGEINLDDLPQPIVETEETRLIDKEIKQQQELYHKKENEINGEGGDDSEED
ncbi:MAG: hypothetical protein IJK60_09850 [Clostridia bacterium]|nr:hypothetical protein [Clostridia bacterium]